MYQVGDLIVYGNAGVCSVAEITTLDSPWAEKDQLYYILKPLYENCVISTPVNNSKVFSRPTISKEEADRLIDMIPSIDVQPYHHRTTQELVQHYESYLATHSCRDLIELTMSLYAKKHDSGDQKGKFGVIDQKFMKRAEDMLFGELAVALGIAKDEVQGYINARLAEQGQEIVLA